MAHTTFAFGYIESDATCYPREECNYWEMQERNAKIIQNLIANPQTKILHPAMFSCYPDFQTSQPSISAVFREQVIHFGGSYRAMLTQELVYEDGWLLEFESLLKQLYWVRAYARFVSEILGEHEARYELDLSLWPKGERRCVPTTKWHRRFFKIDSSEVSDICV